jgi:multidrug efflux pump subunit AcrA (membrane-fusion protein)
VEAIAPLVDSATNTVTVRVRIANPTGQLRGGLFARGALVGQSHQAVVVPPSALLPGDGGAASLVAVVDKDNTVEHRSVAVGTETADAVEIVRGVEVGDRVIVAGGYSLPAHTRVEVGR